jgi:hypothetical protein
MYDTLEVIREEHLQNIYPKEQIINQAKHVGFSKISYFDGFTFSKPRKKSEIIHYVMIK